MRNLDVRTAVILTSIFAAQSLRAQSSVLRDRYADSVSVLIDTAVRHGSPAGLDSARTLIERAMTAFPEDPLLLHYDAYALYRKATLAFANTSNDAGAGALLEEAKDKLERSSRRLPLAETFALQSAVYGQLIARSKNPLTGMILGKKSSDAMSRSIKEGPRNPRVWLLRGIGAIFTPAMWGGGLDKAAEYLQKSASYFEKDVHQKPLPAWGRAEAYLWLGQVYAKQGKPDAARAELEHALRLEPDNGWARALLSGRAHASGTR